MPAYIIFSDATLRDMCRRLPTTEEDFMNTAGRTIFVIVIADYASCKPRA